MSAMTDFSLALAQAVHDTELERRQDEAPDLSPIVNDAVAVMGYHRSLSDGQERSCGDWTTLRQSHDEHVAIALDAAGLLGYRIASPTYHRSGDAS